MHIRRPSLIGGALIALGLASVTALSVAPVGAASSAIIGTASTFSVLAGSAITNTGATVMSGDLGISPDDAVSGFPPGVVGGDTHIDDAVALQAQNDLTDGYDDLAGRASNGTLPGDLEGLSYTPGVYTTASSLLINGTVTLNANNDPDALFIFQIGSTLTTGTDSVVSLINGADPCNVYWQVGSSATLNTNSEFVGTLVALTSITANTDATVEGQLLARNGAVTLQSNDIVTPVCALAQDNGGSTTTTSSTPASTTSTTASVSATTTTSAPATTTTVAGGTTTGTTTGGPPLPATGLGLAPAAAAVVLLVVGALLLWVGRPALNHAVARRYFP